jgi:hypothetical protein
MTGFRLGGNPGRVPETPRNPVTDAASREPLTGFSNGQTHGTEEGIRTEAALLAKRKGGVNLHKMSATLELSLGQLANLFEKNG